MHVVNLGVRKPDTAPEHTAGGVQPTQRPTLRRIGQSGRPTQIHFARRMQYDAVAHYHRMHIGTVEQVEQHPVRHLYRQTPVGHGLAG